MYRILQAVLFLSVMIGVKCDLGIVRAYSRFPGCLSSNSSDTDAVNTWAEFLHPQKDDNDEGFSGTVGIVGGISETSGGAYFAALTALKMGADSVKIFCYTTNNNVLRGFNSDITIHPITNTEIDKAVSYLSKVDVVILGPGLEKDAHGLNTIIPKVIAHCKNEKKPLIIDLVNYFLTPAFINSLAKYPYPGIILIPNSEEFEKYYETMKTTMTTANVAIDWVKFGDNIFILRKGCSDMGISMDPQSSWALASGGSPRRSSGQGHMLAGATAIYYFWALKFVPDHATESKGPMFKAAIAAYGASKLIRECNSRAYGQWNKSMMTSHMIAELYETLSGIK